MTVFVYAGRRNCAENLINFLFSSGDTTESELCRVFSAYGNVKSTKIIVDRAGVSKGYGFVTFETEQEAQRLQSDVSLLLSHFHTQPYAFSNIQA